MSVQYRELYQVWAIRLSMLTTIIVVLLSWFNELRFFELMVRAAVSFGVIYVLMIGCLNLFEKTATPEPEDSPSDLDSSRGGKIDFSVGDDVLPDLVGKETAFPGQIDRNLGKELPDSERQAEIVRRMGWE